VIETAGLSKRFGSKLAVADLTVTIQPGQVTGFLGPNGSGKSTTMRMIMGLDRPSGGTVTINGHRYHDGRWPLREVGALLEARSAHPGRTAFNHLYAMAAASRIPRSRVTEVLRLVGLEGPAKSRVGKFSLGMGQRLGIAAALLGDPGVLLFDEPVNGLDPEGIVWVRTLLRQLAAEGRTVFVSSHLMEEMAKTADQLIVIGQGKLRADTTVDQFIAENSRQRVRVRSPQLGALEAALAAAEVATEVDGEALVAYDVTTDRVGQLAADASVVLFELSPMVASLEEAFMELTGDSVEYHGGTGTGVAA